ncbi:MAG: hypothetical protein ACFCVD_10670 [Nodosilinea sp.]
MNISDLDHYSPWEHPETVQGGSLLATTLGEGLVIAIENGNQLTLFEDGKKLYSRTLKKPVNLLTLKLDGFSGVGTTVRAVGNGMSSSSIVTISTGRSTETLAAWVSQ